MPMPNFTIEDYKEAIRAKYERDINNPLSDSLTSLSQAYLRDFCRQKFEGGLSEDDLRIFASFFGFEFNSTITRNLFKENTDRFRPIGTFLKGQTDLSSREAVDLTAILVDFQHRPFRKFREKGAINYLKHPEDSKIPEPFVVKYEEEIKVREAEETPEVNSGEKKVEDNLLIETNTKNVIDLQSDLVKEEKSIIKFVEVSLPESTKSKGLKLREKISDRFRRKVMITISGVIIVLCSIVTIIHFAFPSKGCMVWVNDHYEEKEKSDDGYCDAYYDARYFDLRKIKVCDTTTFFKDAKPIVWYFRSRDSIEFFDRFAPYPYNRTKHLKPITRYMIDRYVKPRK